MGDMTWAAIAESAGDVLPVIAPMVVYGLGLVVVVWIVAVATGFAGGSEAVQSEVERGKQNRATVRAVGREFRRSVGAGRALIAGVRWLASRGSGRRPVGGVGFMDSLPPEGAEVTYAGAATSDDEFIRRWG